MSKIFGQYSVNERDVLVACDAGSTKGCAQIVRSIKKLKKETSFSGSWSLLPSQHSLEMRAGVTLADEFLEGTALCKNLVSLGFACTHWVHCIKAREVHKEEEDFGGRSCSHCGARDSALPGKRFASAVPRSPVHNRRLREELLLSVPASVPPGPREPSADSDQTAQGAGAPQSIIQL